MKQNIHKIFEELVPLVSPLLVIWYIYWKREREREREREQKHWRGMNCQTFSLNPCMWGKSHHHHQHHHIYWSSNTEKKFAPYENKQGGCHPWWFLGTALAEFELFHVGRFGAPCLCRSPIQTHRSFQGENKWSETRECFCVLFTAFCLLLLLLVSSIPIILNPNLCLSKVQ